MALDPSVYNALSAPRKSAFDYANDAMGAQTNALQLQVARQAMADDQAVRDYYRSGADLNTPEGLQGLYKISPKAGAAAAQQQAALMKDRNAAKLAETQQKAAQFKLTKDQTDHGIQTVLRNNTPEGVRAAVYQGVRDQLYSMQMANQILSDLPTDGDPQKFQKWRMQNLFHLMTPTEQFAAEDKNRRFALEANNQLIGPDGTVNRRLLGAKATVAAAGATNVSYGPPIAGVDAAGNPVFFQPDKRGGVPAIVPGVAPPKSEKPLTEAQSKASVFMSQMQAAENELANTPIDTSKLSSQVDVAIASSPLNIAASPAAQRARQAQEQWAESFLRFKTGAASTEAEVTRNVKTFFPQQGDSKEVIAQKKRMRDKAVSDIAIAAGLKPSAKPGGPSTPSAGTDLGGGFRLK